jgi:mannose-6-phosphate isomerase-like protein (cupin superfamily)
MDSATLPEMPRLHVTPVEAKRAPLQADRLSALLLSYGSMELRWYAPHVEDPQTPHDRDELYVIVSGTAVFMRGQERLPFGEDHELTLQGEERVTVQPGDALFVPAGTVHRFEAMSAEFGAWMIFYGPEGGEAA